MKAVLPATSINFAPFSYWSLFSESLTVFTSVRHAMLARTEKIKKNIAGCHCLVCPVRSDLGLLVASTSTINIQLGSTCILNDWFSMQFKCSTVNCRTIWSYNYWSVFLIDEYLMLFLTILKILKVLARPEVRSIKTFLDIIGLFASLGWAELGGRNFNILSFKWNVCGKNSGLRW